jgi:hypothetical protein
MNFAARRPGNGPAQRGLADARRTHEAQDRPTQFLHALLNGKVLEDPLLDSLEPVVIGLEDVFGLLQIVAHPAALLPGHRKHPVQVVSNHRRFGRHRRHHLELVEFALRLLERLLGHPGLFDLLLEVAEIISGFIQITQFFLDGLHLFVEVILALALLHLGLDPATDALFELEHIDLAFDQCHQLLDPLSQIRSFEHALLVFDADAEMSGDGVGLATDVVDAGQRRQQLGRNLAAQLDVLFEQAQQAAGRHLDGRFVVLAHRRHRGPGPCEVPGVVVEGISRGPARPLRPAPWWCHPAAAASAE